MQLHPLSGWSDHVLAGKKYLQTANRALSRPAVFNNELIFQLTAMAIEKLIAGLCQYHHQMPNDHSLSGLAEALAPACPIDAELAQRIKRIETIDDMCTLAPVKRKIPADADIREILAIGRKVAHCVNKAIPKGAYNQKTTSPRFNFQE